MRRNSSTSASDLRRQWPAIAAFAITFAFLFIPYELAVRRSERIHGVARAYFSPATSALPKIDQMSTVARRSGQLDVLVVGTSVAEYGVDPRLLQQTLEPGSTRPVFNAALGGVSSIVGLDLAETFRLRSKWTIVSVSPMDFTDTAQSRGRRFVSHATELTSGRMQTSSDIREIVEQRTGAIVRSVAHSTSPLRRRTLPDWLRLFRRRQQTDLFAFLNSEAVAEPQCATCWDGYVGSSAANEADLQFFAAGASGVAPGALDAGIAPREFVAEHPAHVEALAQRIERMRRSGSRVVLVRIPTSAGFRAVEDESTVAFDTTMQGLADRTGTAYFGDLVPAGFLVDSRNFVDTHHLSYRGSHVFTRRLGEALRSLDLAAKPAG